MNCETLDPRLDQVGAKLVEEEEPHHKDDKAAQIEDDDATRQRRGESRGEKSQGDARADAQPTKFPPARLCRKAMLNLRFGAHLPAEPPILL